MFFSISIIQPERLMANNQCDCHAELNWVKHTFEKNDAGFEYILKQKGQQAYDEHTNRLMQMAKDIKTNSECKDLLFKWLRFFRKGHIGIQVVKEEKQSEQLFTLDSNLFQKQEKLNFNERDFLKKLAHESKPSPIGIWEGAPYKVAIMPTDSGYTGVVLDAPGTPWKKDQIKFKLYSHGKSFKATLWMRDFTCRENLAVNFIGNNIITIDGISSFVRKSKTFEDTPLIKSFTRYIFSKGPYYEQVSDSTSYVRIPSFAISNKRAIDSVLRVNHEKIIKSPNLIIDLRNNGGGSDASYSSLLPYIYTNPFRSLDVELLSTELNNSAHLAYSQDTLYDENARKRFKETYDKLNLQLGSFVRINKYPVTINSMDRILPNPHRVAILINEYCGSTTEQFLLNAKQSYKVKLFGKSTFGSLDISNMHYANSPSGQFQLWYCRSKSLRIPEMAIDDIGLQPDYFLDSSIAQQDWVEFVVNTFN